MTIWRRYGAGAGKTASDAGSDGANDYPSAPAKHTRDGASRQRGGPKTWGEG